MAQAPNVARKTQGPAVPVARKVAPKVEETCGPVTAVRKPQEALKRFCVNCDIAKRCAEAGIHMEPHYARQCRRTVGWFLLQKKIAEQKGEQKQIAVGDRQRRKIAHEERLVLQKKLAKKEQLAKEMCLEQMLLRDNEEEYLKLMDRKAKKTPDELNDDASTVASSDDDIASIVESKVKDVHESKNTSRKMQKIPDPCARTVQKIPDPCARNVAEETKPEELLDPCASKSIEDDATTVVHYFSSIEMRDLKKLEKKIRDIEKLEALLAAGKAVDPLQKAKISQKGDLLKQKQPFVEKAALGWVCRPQ